MQFGSQYTGHLPAGSWIRRVRPIRRRAGLGVVGAGSVAPSPPSPLTSPWEVDRVGRNPYPLFLPSNVKVGTTDRPEGTLSYPPILPFGGRDWLQPPPDRAMALTNRHEPYIYARVARGDPEDAIPVLRQQLP